MMDLWLFSGTKLRTKFDIIDNYENIEVPEQYINCDAYLIALNNSNQILKVKKETNSSSINSRSIINDDSNITSNDNFIESQIKMIPPKLPDIKPKLTKINKSSRAVINNNPQATTNYSVGDTRTFFGSLESGISAPLAEDSELMAIGNHCRIWYKAKDGIDITDNSVFSAIANKFDSIFEKETYIFGSNIAKYNFSEVIPRNVDKIEILIYDLYDNYETEKANNGGTFGYFYGLDMITNAYVHSEISEYLISNECQCLHLDSYWLSVELDSIISTSAHEFQHLLNFVNKFINSGGYTSSSTWFNEMMSMVCEDIMQTQLGINDSGSPKKRLYWFNNNFNYGFTTWRDGEEDAPNDVYISYANAYTFGAYLLRNYGIDFIYELAHSSYVDQDAITKALIKIHANEKSFDEVFSNYYNVIINPTGTNFTLNKAVEKTYNIGTTANPNNVKFECSAINLNTVLTCSKDSSTGKLPTWFSNQTYKSNPDNDFYGPVILNDGWFYINLAPQGMFASHLGKGYDNYNIARGFNGVDFTSPIAYYVVFVE